jgi:class 3 adenylate cyclase
LCGCWYGPHEPRSDRHGQILVDAKVHAQVKGLAEMESVGELSLKGFHRPVKLFNVRGLQ